MNHKRAKQKFESENFFDSDQASKTRPEETDSDNDEIPKVGINDKKAKQKSKSENFFNSGQA